MAVPDDPPQSKPSSRIKRRAIRNDSSSSVFTYSSINELFKTSGKKSYPIPSTKYDETSVPPPKIEPTGSAPIILIPGISSFNRLATPEIVPPVPTPMTTI